MESKTDKTHRTCPKCDSPVAEDAGTFPFCSERCRLADLGQWFDGGYVISRGLKPEDLDELES
ncbi:MAG: DNA gyrase inhibitor YacG [Planctomycetota bacterium]